MFLNLLNFQIVNAYNMPKYAYNSAYMHVTFIIFKTNYNNMYPSYNSV